MVFQLLWIGSSGTVTS